MVGRKFASGIEDALAGSIIGIKLKIASGILPLAICFKMITAFACGKNEFNYSPL